MLENEPEGGERTGSQPAGDTAEHTTGGDTGAPTAERSAPPQVPTESAGGPAPSEAAGSGIADLGEPKTPTRRRASRRKVAPLNQPEQTDAPVEASADPTVGSGESPQAEVLAPVTGDLDGAAATTPRRRRKATTAKAAAVEPVVADGAEPTTEDVVPPVKVTRTRRRKAVPAAAEPAVETPAEVAGIAEPTVPAPLAATEEVEAEEVEPEAGTAFGAAVPPVSAADEPVPGAAAAPVADSGAESRSGEVPPGVAVSAPADDAAPPAEPRTRRRRAALSAPTVLFMAPQPEDVPVVRATTAPAPVVAEEPAEEAPAEPTRRRRGRRDAEQVEAVEPVEAEEEPTAEDDDEAAEDDDEDESAAARRRRRRGRRGRGRGKGGADDAEDEESEEPAQAEADDAEEEESEEGDGEGDGMTRRRRRRRRRGTGDVEGAADDGVPTVVKIREPRKTVDEVQGVSGSTRLEAKRQRRRDGREQRRTRPPILSESEFLARREAVDRVMAVRQRGDRTQIAVLEDGVLVEHYVTRNSSGTMAGNVYLGKVQNVLPSMEAAFVDVGRGRNAVLYAGEVNWDTTGLEGRARSIEHALRSGDSVLVQVTKDPIGHKGARLTSHIALSGRHLVYVPNGNASGISRKLPDNERKRLRDVLKKLVPDGAGVIVRTAAEGASEDELARDVKRLQAQWEDIQAKAAEGGAPVLLYEEPDLVIRVVRDLFNEDFRELVIEGEQSYGMVESYLSHVSPDLVARLRRHVGTTDVFSEYRIDEQIIKALDRKVFLPSGGSLVIDRTEAMTVVDVNTGKYTGTGGNLEETVTRNNLEAAEEIVRQLRLRDIGGIVVIDFIDMVLESNRELVLRRLTECLGRDRTKHQVTEITSLGLVQMTRKRIAAGLLEAFSETCECCKGRGLVIHTEPVPEKPRSGGGAGEKVKAVATAVAAPAEQSTSSRRRARKNAPAERAVVEVTDTETDVAATTAAAEEYDTMGYDLSRYETDTPAAADVADAQTGDSARLAAADDPDALSDDDTEETEGGTGRRRSRRGGARRRTRP
ncbi:Rne/Rng family ribonuclease [Micromonospora endolithica]|uniref:Ribonuclease E n=1 Tax=Micromonospora endolithica TaxID=230091 RepID=A0A3A9Z2V7_9ACTN|nr:Rne/Rng family ribonuclease [Micromonospora endolithica]RKN42628.1 Rne/Rng family ribonuclease [Micromonospora endolithica]TWJ20001.1 ribonuclease E [Micromonospora endolithica]